MTEEVLDDWYTLEEHEQLAYNGLMALEVITEPLFWTAVPARKLSVNDVIGLIITLPLLFLTALLFIFGFQQTMLMAVGLICLAALLAILLDFWQEEQARKNTFYGISATTLWVKLPKQPLKQYVLAELKRLSIKKGHLIHATILNNTYQEHTLLKQVPNSARVLELLLALQAPTPQ